MDNSQSLSTQQCRAHISSNGRLNIPSQFRKTANIKDGDEVLLVLRGNIIEVQPLDQVIAEAQSIVAEYFTGENLMDSLRELRATDARRETHRLHDEE